MHDVEVCDGAVHLGLARRHVIHTLNHNALAAFPAEVIFFLGGGEEGREILGYHKALKRSSMSSNQPDRLPNTMDRACGRAVRGA